MFDYENTFIKKKIKYEPVDYRRAKVFCWECGEYISTIDVYYNGIENRICEKCANKYIKKVPFKIGEYFILEDFGNSVIVDYGMKQEYKKCHYTSKGRFVKSHGKRYYI